MSALKKKNALRPGDDRDIYAAKWELEFENIFHFKEFYRTAHEFLNERGWKDPDGAGENWEHYYYQKIVSADGRQEHRTWWRVIQDQTSYVRYFMKIDMRGINMIMTEVVINGKKFKTWKGSLVLYCEAYVQLDYKDMWQKNKWSKKLDSFVRHRLYKRKWESYKDDLTKKCYEFNRELKKFWKLKTHLDEPDLFRHQLGHPPKEK